MRSPGIFKELTAGSEGQFATEHLQVHYVYMQITPAAYSLILSGENDCT